MAYDGESDYKYVESTDDVPVTGQGIDRNWDPNDIHDAIEAGEGKLESDVNDGRTIPESAREHNHAEAAAAWATYKLVLGMKSPDATTRGDSLDEGSERMEFAREVKNMYKSYVNSINDAEGDASDSGTIDFEVADW